MIFVVDKPRLQRMIALTRDDRGSAARRRRAGGEGAPFMRIEASEGDGGTLTLSGRQVEATFPATVHQPGVLFMRITLFRRALATLTKKCLGGRFLTVQVAVDGLHFADTWLGFEIGDMLLYPNADQAPAVHPAERATHHMTDDGSASPWGPLFNQVRRPDPEVDR